MAQTTYTIRLLNPSFDPRMVARGRRRNPRNLGVGRLTRQEYQRLEGLRRKASMGRLTIQEARALDELEEIAHSGVRWGRAPIGGPYVGVFGGCASSDPPAVIVDNEIYYAWPSEVSSWCVLRPGVRVRYRVVEQFDEYDRGSIRKIAVRLLRAEENPSTDRVRRAARRAAQGGR